MKPKVGLVLGGGGSRGVAHIGVLQVLHRHQIPIDFIVGTSMGGIIGVLYAIGLEPDTIAEQIEVVGGSNVFVRNLFSARSRQTMVRDLLATALEGKTFADLKTPLTLIAVDVQRGVEVELNKGLLLPAVLASSAVPAVFPPVNIEGASLADGGIIDSMSTHVAYEQGADVVIGVDVYPPLEQDHSWHDPLADIMGMASPLSLFSVNNSPSMVAAIWRSVRIMTWHLHQRRLETHPPHVLIRPAVEQYGSLDFRDISGPLQAGVAATEAELEDIQALVAARLSKGKARKT